MERHTNLILNQNLTYIKDYCYYQPTKNIIHLAFKKDCLCRIRFCRELVHVKTSEWNVEIFQWQFHF